MDIKKEEEEEEEDELKIPKFDLQKMTNKLWKWPHPHHIHSYADAMCTIYYTISLVVLVNLDLVGSMPNCRHWPYWVGPYWVGPSILCPNPGPDRPILTRL